MTRALRIPLDEFEWTATGSGGPGGQHANTANTKVAVTFDIAGSPSLGPRQRARLLERFGPRLRVASSLSRSQMRNREDALDRLSARLAGALRTERARRPSARTRSSVEERLRSKAERAETKRARRPPGADD